MRHITIIILVVAMAGCNNSNTNTSKTPKADSTAATATPAQQPAPPKMDSAMAAQKMMESMTPGAMQKMMASWDGKWTNDMEVWMDPKAPSQHITGTTINKMILGGRYEESIHTSNMMGQPFEGRATLGFDNGRKLFVSSWIDNFGTGIVYMEGPYDSVSKTITLIGTWEDPVKGKMTMKQITKIIDDTHQETEMYSTEPGGAEKKIMSTKMTKS